MKTVATIFAAFACLFTSLFSQSNLQQSLSINGAGTPPDASALLDVSANNKGILIPRMSTIERIAIASPATGLLVYDSSNNGFWFYNGVGWVDLSAPKLLLDTDGDTRIEVEQSFDEDIVRINLAGSERLRLRQSPNGSTMVEFPNNGDDTYLGTSAGLNNTSGDNNTAVGKTAMTANTTGSNNSALGAFALSSNNSGTENTAIGTFALSDNTNAIENTAVGYSALAVNTASQNTAVGAYALLANTSGDDNSAVGSNAMKANVTGSDNAALGNAALFSNTTGSENVAVGRSALQSNTTGSFNTGMGRFALRFNTNASFNTAVGALALEANTAGANTALGYSALANNTTGDSNVGVGSNALLQNGDGFDNTAVGGGAMTQNTTGGNNTAVGADALDDNTTGLNNTAIGDNALTNNTTGSSNTALGFEARVSTANQINATAIGARAEVAGNNNLVLGSIIGVNGATSSVNVGIGISNPALRLHILGGSDISPAGGGYIQTGSSTGNNVAIDENEIMARLNGAASLLLLNNEGGDVKIGNSTSMVGVGRTATTNNLEVEGAASKTTAGDWLANSDARLKKNITPLNSQQMLQKLLALQGVTYEWNDDKTGSKRPAGIQYGFTAQNVQAVFPTLVQADKLGYLQTAYGTFDAMTVEAMRALNSEIENLKSENAAQAAEIDRLKKLEMLLEKISAALQNAGISVEK